MRTRINRTMRLAVAAAATIGTPALAQLVSVELAYPPAALRAGKEGVVGYAVGIAKDGRVTRCRVTQTSGDAVLDRETCASCAGPRGSSPPRMRTASQPPPPSPAA